MCLWWNFSCLQIVCVCSTVFMVPRHEEPFRHNYCVEWILEMSPSNILSFCLFIIFLWKPEQSESGRYGFAIRFSSFPFPIFRLTWNVLEEKDEWFKFDIMDSCLRKSFSSFCVHDFFVLCWRRSRSRSISRPFAKLEFEWCISKDFPQDYYITTHR